METRLIQCNTKEIVYLTLPEKSNGLEMVLVDDRYAPIARYTFGTEKLKGINSISYHSNNVKIHFEDITSSTLSELAPVVEQSIYTPRAEPAPTSSASIPARFFTNYFFAVHSGGLFYIVRLDWLNKHIVWHRFTSSTARAKPPRLPLPRNMPILRQRILLLLRLSLTRRAKLHIPRSL